MPPSYTGYPGGFSGPGAADPKAPAAAGPAAPHLLPERLAQLAEPVSPARPPPAPIGDGRPILPVREFIELTRYASGTVASPPVWMTHTPPGHLGGVHGYLLAGARHQQFSQMPHETEHHVKPVLEQAGCHLDGPLPVSFFQTRHNPYRFLEPPPR